jgi:hypothetical protein
MKAANRFYKKAAFFLIAFFIISFTVMALDQHNGGYSPSCPICQAKILFNGVQDAIILSFYPEIAYHPFLESFYVTTIPAVLSIQNKAPPEFFLS